jgi:hypothetical protein
MNSSSGPLETTTHQHAQNTESTAGECTKTNRNFQMHAMHEHLCDGAPALLPLLCGENQEMHTLRAPLLMALDVSDCLLHHNSRGMCSIAGEGSRGKPSMQRRLHNLKTLRCHVELRHRA